MEREPSKIAAKFLLIFICLIVILGLIWLFAPSSETSESKTTVRVKNTFSGLKERVFSTISIKDSLELNEPTYDIIQKNGLFYTISGEVEISLNLVNARFKKIEKIDFEDAVVCKYNSHSKDFIVLFNNETDNQVSAYTLNGASLNLLTGHLPYDFTAQFYDNRYIYLGNRLDSLYLHLLNTPAEKHDSLLLNSVYKNWGKQLGFVLSGNFLCFKNTIYHFPIHCSYGFKMNLGSLDVKPFNTLDSTLIPTFKEVNNGDGFSKFTVDPEIFVNVKQSIYKNQIANLSYLSTSATNNSMNNSETVIDLYDLDMKYLSSFKIPNHNKTYFVISFCFDERESLLYVLYSDNKTIKVFDLNGKVD